MHQLAEVRHLLVQGRLKRALLKGARKWATISIRDIEAVLRERPKDPLVLNRAAIASWDLGASYAPMQRQHRAAVQKARDLWDRARRAPGGAEEIGPTGQEEAPLARRGRFAAECFSGPQVVPIASQELPARSCEGRVRFRA